MATPSGCVPTARMVVVTVLVAVLITDTVLAVKFATYTRVPSGVTAMPSGFAPTGTVATIVLVAVLITETLLLALPLFATYTRVPSGLTATPRGPAPAAREIVVMTVLVATSITVTLLAL